MQFLVVFPVLFWGGLFGFFFPAVERDPFRIPDKSIFSCGLGPLVPQCLRSALSLQIFSFDTDTDPSLSVSELPKIGNTASDITECERKNNEG